MNSFIIFGAGKKGKNLLSFLGEDRVLCFCDNKLSGEKVDGKEVISFSEMVKLSEEKTVLLSTDNETMRDQLKEAGVSFVDCSDSYAPLHDILAEDYDYCKDSEVEFYVVDSFEITHYLPLYYALGNAGIRAVMVAEPCLFNTAGKWFDEDKTWKLLNELGIEWYKRSNLTSKVAITTEFGRNLVHYHGKKVQLCYGVSFLKKKAFELEAEVTRPFDHIFVNGKFYKKMISKNRLGETITDIAYPRYREFFLDHPSKEEVLKRLGISTDKPILVYYPTWDDHSSIPKYSEKLAELKDDYYIISKPHHCTLRLPEKRDDLRSLQASSDFIADKVDNLSELALITDLAICDAMSGAMTEVAYLNRDVRMLAIMEPGTRDEFHLDPGKLTVAVDDPSEFVETARSLKNMDPMLEERKKLMSELISDDFDAAMERCLQAIRSLMEDKETDK